MTSVVEAEQYLRVHSAGGNLEALTRLLDRVKQDHREACCNALHLPKITDDLADNYKGYGFVKIENNKLEWTQESVDFVSMMKIQCLNATGEER